MRDIRNNIRNLKNSISRQAIEAELVKIIQRNRRVILDLNRSQLMAGIDSKSRRLAPYKNKKYANFKRTLNPRGVTDLKLNGDFHQNFFIVSEIPLIIFSYDSKTDKLIEKFGKEIFGLTDENKKIFMVGYIRIELQNYFRQIFRI